MAARPSGSRIKRGSKGLMDKELQRIVENWGQGDHVCLVYRTLKEQLSVVVPYLMEGLRRGEACLYIVDDQPAQQIVAALNAAGVDTVHAHQRGALEFMNKRESYLNRGRFSPTRMLQFLKNFSDRKKAEGFKGLRGTGEMTWALGPELGCHRLFEYESWLEKIMPSSDALCLCQFNRRRFSKDCMPEILRTHRRRIMDVRKELPLQGCIDVSSATM